MLNMKTKWHHNSKRTINTLNRENWCENKINSKLSRTTQNEPTTKPSIFNRIKLIYWNLYLFRIDHHTHSLPSIGVYLHWLRIQFRYAWMRQLLWERENEVNLQTRTLQGIPNSIRKTGRRDPFVHVADEPKRYNKFIVLRRKPI